MRQKIKNLSLAVGVLEMLTMLAFDTKYVKEANNVLRGVMATGTDGTDGTDGTNASGGTDTSTKTKIAKVVQVGRSLYITQIQTNASVDIKVGMRVTPTIQAKFYGKVTWEAKGEYKTDCVFNENSDAICIPNDWRQCPATGCPKDGSFRS